MIRYRMIPLDAIARGNVHEAPVEDHPDDAAARLRAEAIGAVAMRIVDAAEVRDRAIADADRLMRVAEDEKRARAEAEKRDREDTIVRALVRSSASSRTVLRLLLALDLEKRERARGALEVRS